LPPKRYWLFKTEPDVYSIEHLAAEPDQTCMWDGIRNYQARNLLRDDIKVGDGVLIYHSRTKVLGVAGRARVVRAGHPDPTQFDPKQKYHDAKSDPENPRWICVDVKLEKIFPRLVTLDEMKVDPALAEMRVIQRGQRLSIQPVSAAEWKRVLALSRKS